jgi:hypothetical protein
MAGIVRNLMVRAVADFSGLQRSMQQAQRETSAFASGMEKAFGGLKSKLALLGGALLGGAAIKDAISDAIELEATTQNLNHILGKSAEAYIQWSQTVATSYGYSQNEAEKYGASFAHMISLFGNGTEDIRKKTEDLMKMSAIVANGTGRSIDDVMQRIQSGMLGNVQAINDLGIYANQSMLEASKAFQQVAHGRHWADLTMAERQQVIYMSIMEQGAKQYGNTLQNNVHNKLVTFTATLKNLRVALGNAFLPLLNVALPVITKFIQGITVALNYFAAFMRAIFGFKSENAKQAADTAKTAAATAKQTNATNAQTGAVKKLTQATKDQQKAQMSLAGIDEINSIKSANNAMSGAGDSGVGTTPTTGGTGDITPPDITPPDSSGWTAALDAIEKKAKEFADNFVAWLSPLQPYWDNLKDAVGHLGDSISNLWNSAGMQAFIGWLADYEQWAIGATIDEVTSVVNTLADGIQTIADILNGDMGKAWKDFQQTCKDIYDSFFGFGPLLVGIVAGFAAFTIITTVVGWIKDMQAAMLLLNIAMDANPIGLLAVAIGALVTGIIAVVANWDTISQAFKDFGSWFNEKVATPFGDFVNNLTNGMKDIGSKIWGWITDKWGDVAGWFKTNIVDKITGAFGALGKLGATIFGYVKSGWSGLYNWFKTNIADHVGSAFSTLANLGSKLWGYVKSGWGSIKTWFQKYIVGPISSAFSAVTNLGGKIWAGLKSGWGAISSWFKKYVADPIHSVFSKITNGLGSTITSGFKVVYNGAAKFINGFIGLLNKLINKLKDVNVFGNHPFGGLPTIPTIPYLAKGGVVNKATLAMIGESGKEAVMPLENNTGWINQLAQQIAAVNGGGNQGGDVILQIGETVFGKIAINAINKVHRRGGKVLLNV